MEFKFNILDRDLATETAEIFVSFERAFLGEI